MMFQDSMGFYQLLGFKFQNGIFKKKFVTSSSLTYSNFKSNGHVFLPQTKRVLENRLSGNRPSFGAGLSDLLGRI